MSVGHGVSRSAVHEMSVGVMRQRWRRRTGPPGEHEMAYGGGSKETRGELRTGQGRGEGQEKSQGLQCPEAREGQGVASTSEWGWKERSEDHHPDWAARGARGLTEPSGKGCSVFLTGREHRQLCQEWSQEEEWKGTARGPAAPKGAGRALGETLWKYWMCFCTVATELSSNFISESSLLGMVPG